MVRTSQSAELGYARQLDRDFRLLRFKPALEVEFRRSFALRTRSRTLVGLTIGLLLTFSFVALDVFTGRFLSGSKAVWLIVALIVPGLMACIALGMHAEWRRWLSPACGVLMGLIGVGIVLATVESRRRGGHFPYEVLMTLAVYTYFLVGLTFYRALICALLAVGAYAGAGFGGAYGRPDFYYDLYFVVSVYILGGWGCYIAEYAERRDFLQRRMLSELAQRDALTGLANRRSLETHLKKAWREAEREHSCVAIVMCDIDHFKGYNDTYGHPAGDECLRKVADAIGGQFRRPMDMAARYGGEEFAGLWFNVDPDSVAGRAEELRAAVENLRIAHEASSASRFVTISIGVVILYPDSRVGGPEVAIQHADQALYRSKKMSRNRVEISRRIPSGGHTPRPDIVLPGTATTGEDLG